MVYLL